LRSLIVRAASVLFLAVPAALCVIASAEARSASSAADRPWSTDGGPSMVAPWAGSRSPRSSFSAPRAAQQDGGFANHLPAARENMELVSKLELTAPFGNVLPGQIADVSVHKNAAYLMSWSPQDDPALPCRRGGFFSVDISNPAAPVQRAFVPALPETYHGEGAHAITLDTPAFKGDLLAVNNEPCATSGVGGFDLYDVSNPAQPVTLIQGAGDKSPDDETELQDPNEVANSSHSIFIWQDGVRAYAVTVDNTELHDVDIFDITNPRDPEFIADLNLTALFPQIVANSANGNAIFHHDMVVKRINGRMTMLNSYWDGGYVQLDVSDPANPTHVTDTDFPDVEPLVPLVPPGDAPEGNAHQAEFSHDNQFILAADEDFGTARAVFEITDGPNAGTSPAGEFSFSQPIRTLPDARLNGPTVYGGYGCSALDEIPPAASAFAGATFAPGEERILVVQRGPVDDPSHPVDACRFDEKMQNAIAKGYEGIMIGQRHLAGAAADGTFCGGGDPRSIRGMCITHETMHGIFNDPPGYDLPYPPGHGPVPGTLGARVSATTVFDGWGYAHLYDANTSELVDDFAIQEGLDERYASGFGDLSIHEFATDPATNLAYASYYSGGLRVLSFSRAGGLKEVGRFIDEGGSNFWGVEQFTDQAGNRLIAGSDRDYGLYIVKYTGPGAVLASTPPPPSAAAAAPAPSPPPPVQGSAAPASSLFSFGSLKRLTISRRRASATLTVPGPGRATATLRATIGRTSRQIGTASSTATRAGKLRLTFRLTATNERLLRRTLSQRPTRRTSGSLRVSYAPPGGSRRTRNKSLSIAMR